MAVPYKAPVKDIIFGYEVIDSYNVLNKISAFSDFSEISTNIITYGSSL